MKWTKSLIQTLRESPQDAEIESHKLLVRASLVRKVAGGLYAYLPLGMRVLKKIQEIVREEMDRTGAQEAVLPIMQPAELWRQTGRWDAMGANMFRIKDRAQRDVALSPTAEEEMTEVVKGMVNSYRQLPFTVYQIQWKFRDETRPRFGLMRSKEFLMKDAYSFDKDAEGLDRTYWIMYHAYERVFERCGLKAVPVQADGGDMGDSLTHEFHVLADAGEDGIAWCEHCGYAANQEAAGSMRAARQGEGAEKTVKYLADGKIVAVRVEANRDVNEVKLKRFLGAKTLFATSDAEEAERTVADLALGGEADLVLVKPGDACPHCGRPLAIRRGIEVGQVFKLGTKYSSAFGATYKTDELKEETMVMGCYGIGVSRTMQAVIEQCRDKDGIVWPASVAPYQVVISLLDPGAKEASETAEALEAQLEAAGIDVIVDDREERPGVKFKDADLIGFPVRVVVGMKGLQNGGVEVKRRADDKSKMVIVKPEEAVATIKELLK